MQFKNFTLDPFQEEAINIIEKHKNDNKRIIYTASIKALSNQKYRDFSKEYGEDKIGLMTGDIVINPHAKILIMTTEIYRNMAVSNDSDVGDIAYVIFD